MRRNRAEAAVVGAERSPDAYRWSNYSHNVAGLILLGMSMVALAGAIARPGGWRHWPLGFIALAAFVYLRASANEGTWPFGPVPLWTIDAEGLQHRIAAVLVLALGVLEWRARTHPEGRRLPYVFPALAAAGAVLLLTHSHAAFQTKQSFLVQVTHTTMGALAALLVAARWLELRLSPPAARLAGAAASAAMLMIALILLFYREANVVIPPN
jgi:putative copper resistance protein D